MNKKLFTLLTSAAMMAAMAPSVFAETMDFRIKKASEADGKVTYDISVRADKGITGLQWYFTSNGGLGTNDTFDEDDEATAGFHYDSDGVKAMFKKGDLTYTPELHKMPGFADKADETDNYQVAGAATGSKTGDATTELKIGTLVVEGGSDTWVDVNLSKSKATYNDDAGEVVLFDWNLVTDGEDSKPDDSKADDSKEESSVADSSAADSKEESKADESKEESSVADSSAADSSAADSSAADSSAADSSTAAGGDSSNGGSNGSPDTGVASTAVVALAAASAALVVVSKKRK